MFGSQLGMLLGSIKEPTTRMTRIPPKAKMPEMAQVSIRTKKVNTHIEPTNCRVKLIFLRGILLRSIAAKL